MLLAFRPKGLSLHATLDWRCPYLERVKLKLLRGGVMAPHALSSGQELLRQSVHAPS